MGDWSDYFEDFPEENPANYVDGRFIPNGGAASIRAQRIAHTDRIATEQANLDAEIRRIIQQYSKPSNKQNKP